MNDLVINDFEGPLDLLLHLVKKLDVDIMEIKIVDIINQYLVFIEGFLVLDLEKASEYLVMAAELIELKSRMLIQSKNDEEELSEQKLNLINRIIDYEQYKNLANKFNDMTVETGNTYSRPLTNFNSYLSLSSFNVDVTMDILLNSFNDLMKKVINEKPLVTNIQKKEYSVKQRFSEILNILKIRDKVSFVDLIDIRTKDYLVVSFLAILVLVKNEKVYIKQDNYLGDIVIYLG